MGFNSSKSSTDPGAWDQASNIGGKDNNYQMQRDKMNGILFGSPTYASGGSGSSGSSGGNYNSGYSGGASRKPTDNYDYLKSIGSSGMDGAGLIDPNHDYSKDYANSGTGSVNGPRYASNGQGGGSSQSGKQTGYANNGLIDQFVQSYKDKGKNGVFGDQTSGAYQGEDFGSSGYQKTGYNPYQYNQSKLGETSINPEEYGIASQLIGKGAQRQSAANIAKYQDNAAYRGTSDLDVYRAQQENRGVNENVADQNRQLASEQIGRQFQDRQNVNRYNADSYADTQKSQAGENFAAAQFGNEQNKFADSQNLAYKQAGEQSKQFGYQGKLEYLKNKMAEGQFDQDSLLELGKLLTGYNDAGRRGSSSKSSSMGMSAPFSASMKI